MNIEVWIAVVSLVVGGEQIHTVGWSDIENSRDECIKDGQFAAEQVQSKFNLATQPDFQCLLFKPVQHAER